jgi:succinyl-CoA synthetase beta subunit
MARLHEYQGKAILAASGFKVPRGRAVSTADDAVATARELAGEAVIKIQAWTTGRTGIGGVAFAKKPDEVRAHAARMLAMKVGQFPVEAVLVEEKIAIEREFFLSFAIDDTARAPVIIFAAGGGSGIEERASSIRRIPCDVNRGPLDSAVGEAVTSCGLSPAHAAQLSESIQKLFAAARSVEARSLEINPPVLTKDGQFVAADCRITIDDYAVARHPDLKIEIARVRSSAHDSGTRGLRRRTKRSSRHILFRAVGHSGRERFQRSRWLSRCGRRRINDVDGRHREHRIHHRQFHRHQRQSIRLQGLSRAY